MKLKEYRRDRRISPGEMLNEGRATIVAATEVIKPDDCTMEHGIILCVLTGNDVTPWVTWYVNSNDEMLRDGKVPSAPVAYWGHYHSTWLEATAEFAKRAKGWPLVGRFLCHVEEGDVPLRNMVDDVDAALDRIESLLSRTEAIL